MGRSVSTPSDAVEVFYLDYSYEITDEDLDESLEANERTDLCSHDREDWRHEMEADQFDDLIEDLQLNVFSQFPSVGEVDWWLDREDHVIAANDHAWFGISEYCGLAAIWVVAAREQYDEPSPLALHWISQAWPKIEAMFPNRLSLMGRFSNGEAVYHRTEREDA